MSAHEAALAADMAAFHQRENARRDLHQQHADEVSREAAKDFDGVVEEVIIDELHNRLSEFIAWAEDTDDASGYHVLDDAPVFEVALVARCALHAANLLATRPEREIKAEGAAQALRKLADDIDSTGYGWTSVVEAERFRDRIRRRATSIESEAGERQ